MNKIKRIIKHYKNQLIIATFITLPYIALWNIKGVEYQLTQGQSELLFELGKVIGGAVSVVLFGTLGVMFMKAMWDAFNRFINTIKAI